MNEGYLIDKLGRQPQAPPKVVANTLLTIWLRVLYCIERQRFAARGSVETALPCFDLATSLHSQPNGPKVNRRATISPNSRRKFLTAELLVRFAVKNAPPPAAFFRGGRT